MEAEPEQSALLAALDVRLLKAAGSFLGVVGTAGGGFAALSFGTGYLAVKAHDAMVGIPTIADYTTYIRTGSLFLPSSVYLLSRGATPLLLLLCLGIGAFAVLPFLGGDRKDIGGGRGEWVLFVLVQALLLALAVWVLSAQVGAFDPRNKNLLYHLVVPDAAAAASPPPVSWWHLAERSARDIRAELVSPEGTRPQRRYGRQLGLAVLFMAGVLGVRQWRARRRLRPRTGTSADPLPMAEQVVDWFLYPLLCVLGVAILANLPSTYGVLCLPTDGAWVEIKTEPPGPCGFGGYLLSDLSTETSEVWLLGREGDDIVLRSCARGSIRMIAVTGQYSPNFLAPEPQKVADE